MTWIVYFLVFLAVCVVWFFITRIWVNGIDLIISIFKKVLGLDKDNNEKSWHTLEEIRDKNQKD